MELLNKRFETQWGYLGKKILASGRGGKILRQLLRLPYRLCPHMNKDSYFASRYIIRKSKIKVKVVIEASDNHMVLDENALKWADVFFKANMWENVDYPSNVVPIANCNGRLDDNLLNQLVGMRNTNKTVDICFISRIWGGIEHNIRLFETLAKLDCSKDLLAIFPTKESKDRGWKRLQDLGIECTENNIPMDVLWNRMSRSKINFFRSGVKLCIPWRMIDLLAMGSCVLFDDAPRPVWPQRLVEEKNYVDCQLDARLDSTTEEYLDSVDYNKIVNKVEELLNSPERINAISRNNEAYYDKYASPVKVAEYIIDTALGRF